MWPLLLPHTTALCSFPSSSLGLLCQPPNCITGLFQGVRETAPFSCDWILGYLALATSWGRPKELLCLSLHVGAVQNLLKLPRGPLPRQDRQVSPALCMTAEGLRARRILLSDSPKRGFLSVSLSPQAGPGSRARASFRT